MSIPRINEQENFVPLPISAYFGDEKLAIGTAFHYRHKEKEYLVTNWHNVTGREPTTFKPKSKQAALPDRLSLGLPIRASDDGNTVELGWRDHILELYEDPERMNPTWFEHPIHGAKVDVVVIQVDQLKNTALRFANEICDQKVMPRLRAGMEVFVLGYPRGLTGGGRFPIWKRGSIATEPDVNVENLPLTYIDTATREGMSGAPVFASESGSWIPDGRSESSDMAFGVGRRFLGIYSGRVGEDSFLAQLGLVWKESAIVEIIEGGVSGKSSFGLSTKTEQ